MSQNGTAQQTQRQAVYQNNTHNYPQTILLASDADNTTGKQWQEL